MLEFTNKAKNRIKVINVTEARGNFATILSDTESSYVITKNNKPQRVIVNYDDFKRWQDAEGAALLLSAAPDAVEEDKNRQRRPKMSPAVRGMIAAQFEVSHQAEEKPVRSEAPAGSLDAFLPLPAEEAPSGDEGVFLSAPPQEPDDVVAIDDTTDLDTSDYFTDEQAEEDAAPLPPRNEVLAGAADIAREVAAETRAAAAASNALVAAQARDDGLVEAPQGKTPEEQEYYKRYRKLYENFQYAPVFTERRTTRSAPEDDINLEILSREAARETILNETPATEDVLPPVATAPEASTDFNDSFAMSLVSEEERRVLGVKPPEAPNPESLAAAPTQEEGLPSLQQLLRDLDSQQLSGDESRPLDAKEIDDLINRITSD